jgi:acetylornithine deacetylase/succinyl-diaminopimelate desuccinylase-like protein
MQAGHAENALPQRARAVVNCRILPGVPPETVASVIGRLVDDTRISITSMQTPTPSSPSPLDPGILLPIEQTTEEMWPGIPVIPTMSTGATDGLYLRNAGIPVYGVSGIFGDIDDVRAHGRDERISAKSFYEGQEFLYRLVRRLAF